MAQIPKRASSAPFFYGRITRDEAEKILKNSGAPEGMYLLRESINPIGNYNLSICRNGGFHHYIIQKEQDGQYMIPDGQKFPGPLELLDHYANNFDGLVTSLGSPCNRGPNQQAVAFRGMTYDDLEKEMITRARAIRNVNLEKALGPMRDQLVKMVAKDLHLKQPWFHSRITREEAEARIQREMTKNGQFLVRQRDDRRSFALTMCHNNEIKHYLISLNGDEKYFIDDGPMFDCLIMLIDHYHNKQDGLPCKLSRPCRNPSSSQAALSKYLKTCNEHLFSTERSQSVTSANSTDSDLPPEDEAPRPFQRNSSRVGIPLPKIPNEQNGATSEDHDNQPDDSTSLQFPDLNTEDLEDDYMEIRRRQKRFELEPNRLTLQENLGSGQFGSVVKGLCRLGDKEVPVAIKTLKNEQLVPGIEPELYREAKLMQELEHKHIVQMMGICKTDCIMLVLELAPLGPFNKYLQQHKNISQVNIVRLLLQVAKGMSYLESKKFVHRDLAARNVLLVSEKYAKISDFGMSKALSRDSNYYEAQGPGKWPLKWYAIECILYFKFDSKSDVWSYGVTMWEALSHGGKPFQHMKCQELLDFLQSGQRLSKPDKCCDKAYSIMRECWEEDKNLRPSFSQLVNKMELLYQNLLLND